MMAHAAREAPPFTAAPEYYRGDFLPPQVPGDPATFHRPQHQLSEEASTLADALAGIEIASSARGKPGLPQNKELVVHAIEAAATVLKDQASALRDQIAENDRLRSELRVREWELQNYHRIDQGQGSRQTDNQSQDDSQTLISSQPLGPTASERSSSLQGPNPALLNRELWSGNDFLGDPQSSLIVHPNVQSLAENPYLYYPNGAQGLQYSSNFGANGVVRGSIPDVAFSHASSPIIRSMSPIRLGRESESAGRHQSGAVGNTQPRQDLVKSTMRPQDEINYLKKRLSDCTIKEMQLVHENHMLEKRMSELRLTIEKYQQELVDAISRETSIKQDALEENAHLSSELRTAHQDIHFYASSLMPLLAEFNVQPATRDPHSIVSGIKALVQHLRDQHLREEGRKELIPPKQTWRNSHGYPPSQHGVSSSPVHPMSWAPKSPEPHGLEIVPQSYLQPERPLSPTSPLARNPGDWDMSGVANPQHPFSNDNYNENARRHAYSAQTAEPQHMNYVNPGLQHNRSDPYNDGDEEPSATGHSYGPEYSERPERLSPQLATVREEAASSLSDEDDPLPDIEGLCINGDAILGSKILACGISINGTTLCHFQWVRHHRNGHFFHIPGAAQPDYTITADDVDTLLSLECTPMDDRNRKGEMVQVFVNNHNWIALEADMKEQIFEYLESGQAIFEVKLVVENAQESSLEPVILSLKRSMYELKRVNGKRVVGSERYASESAVEIKVGKDSQCAILNNTGIMHLLDCSDNRTRDLLVLTMREFIKSAVERKRGKKSFWSK